MVTSKAKNQIDAIGPITEIQFPSQPTYSDWVWGLEITAEMYDSKPVMWIFYEGVSLSRNEFKMGLELAKSLFPPTIKIAFVFKHDPSVGMVHLYSGFQHNNFTNVMVFWSEVEASKWLLERYDKS